MTHITIVAVGSRGDVEPYVALGIGLRDAGFGVRLVTTADFTDFVAGYGLDVWPLEGDFRALMAGDAGQQWLQSDKNPAQFMVHGWQMLAPMFDGLYDGIWHASQGTDAIIGSMLGLAAYPIAQRLNVPFIEALLQPIRRTRAFPFMTLPDIGGSWNYASHRFIENALWLTLRYFADRWSRRIFGVPTGTPCDKPATTTLFAYSPHILPKPDDWGSEVAVTGYWWLPDPVDWTPSVDLVDFLDDGLPPVFVGFGSMSSQDAAASTEHVIAALRKAKQRGVLAAGWGGLAQSDLPDDIIMVGEVPYRWLFPRMAAIIHHGGAGTTGAGLRAGVPSTIAPFIADQYFWGRLLVDLGAGCQPIPQRTLSVDALAYAMRVMTTHAPMRQRAKVHGAQLQAEDGVAEAVRMICQIIG